VFESSFGIVEFVDLPAPMDKYRKTLYKALVTKPIDLIVLVIDATSLEHQNASCLEWTRSLDIPILQVITKGDLLQSPLSSDVNTLVVSAVTGNGLENLKEGIVNCLRSVDGVSNRTANREDQVLLSVDEAWTKGERLVVMGGILEAGTLKKGMALRFQSSRRVSELCKILDIRDESGQERDSFDLVGRYCTLGMAALSTDDLSTCSSSGEILRAFKRVRPPAILSSQTLQFTDCFYVKLKYYPSELKEGHCLIYWRGDRQQAKITKDSLPAGDIYRVHLTKRAGFFPNHMRVIIETIAKGPVYVGQIHHP
jgi:hypothetical protein